MIENPCGGIVQQMSNNDLVMNNALINILAFCLMIKQYFYFYIYSSRWKKFQCEKYKVQFFSDTICRHLHECKRGSS